MIRKRWQLSTDGGITFDQEVTPVNSQSIKFSYTRKLKEGEIFFRTKLTSPLRFKGADFDFFYSWERTSVRRCNEIFIRQQRICDDGEAITFWTGKFSTGAGSFNLDACECEFLPEALDDYSCLYDHWEDKHNILSIDPQTVTGAIASRLSFILIANSPGTFPNFVVATTWNDPRDGCPLTLFWRELVDVDCDLGGPVAPSSGGWTMVIDRCATSGNALWWRPPTIPWTFGTPVAGTLTDPTNPTSVPIPPDDSCDWRFLGTEGCYDGVTFLDFQLPWYICDPDLLVVAHEFSIVQARSFSEAIELLAEDCGLEIQSDFFEINPPGDAPGYSPGVNYVTGLTNQMNDLHLVQLTDAVDPAASDPATRGELTMKELLKIMSMWRVYWSLNGNVLRLEHWNFYNFTQGLDLTTGENFELNRMFNRYSHLKQEIPLQEKLVTIYTDTESGSDDFVGLPIIYSEVCSTTDKDQSILEWKIPQITTDWPGIYQAISWVVKREAVPKTGFFLIAGDGSGSMILDFGAITGLALGNAPLSTANLMRDFWTWDRPMKRANMNGADVVFDGIIPNIEQPDLKARFCCGMETWNPQNTVKTELGQRFLNFRQAFVEKAELEDYQDRLTITPRYAY